MLRVETFSEWLIDDGGESREVEVWLWRLHLRVGWRTKKKLEWERTGKL